MSSFLTRRAGFWHYARRVPTPFVELDPRGIVKQSTKIRVADDPRGVRAARIADRINTDLEAYWRSLAEGRAADARLRYDAARKRARALGFEYLTVEEQLGRPVLDLVERIERVVASRPAEESLTVAAALGGERMPDIMLSDVFTTFEQLSRGSRGDLSENQRRKWGNPKRRAIANLQEVVGDKPLAELNRDNLLEFRTWWQDRIEVGEVQVGTANKDFSHIKKMVATIDRAYQLKLDPIFHDLRIDGEVQGERRAYEPHFVQTRILNDGALTTLNDEARRIVFLIIETGLRPSEAANLREETIRLDAEVPHVEVTADGRRMKTPQSGRTVPLVGVALEVLRLHPEGFPRYRDKTASLSALVNKYLGEHKLRPTPRHTLYSFRHTFEDRLTAIETADRIAAALMGHSFHRPRYGQGPTLALKRDVLQRIAFVPPSFV